VPTLSIIGIASAIALLLLAARSRLLGIFALAVAVGAVVAPAQVVSAGDTNLLPKRVLVLVDKNSTVTAQSIVNSAAFGAGNPGSISPGLSAESPTRANYLLPIRAQGDFQTLLRDNPDEPRSKLERYLIVRYPETANLAVAVQALLEDQNFEYAYIPADFEFSSQRNPALPELLESSAQPWRTLIGLDGAHSISGGWSTVGVADNGIQMNHPALRSFSDQGAFLGGNFLQEFSLHIALRAPWGSSIEYYYDQNVDEKRTVAAPPACDLGTGVMSPFNAGHGTHVAGLVAGRDASGNGISGACQNCGLMVWRISETRCNLTASGFQAESAIFDESRLIAALTHLSDIGAQVVNNSFGLALQGRCADPNASSDAYCLALATASARGVIVSAAAGNNRGAINFPAEDPRVVAVGGVKDSGEFWADRLDLPGSLLQQECPNPGLVGNPFGTECGSNYTVTGSPPTARQEVVMPSLNVQSAFYVGENWNPFIHCGDGFGGGSTLDGYGACTGTSMSAPIYSGMIGLIRSANPLLLPGSPVPSAGQPIGLRAVVAMNSSIPGTFNTWDSRFGHGIPDAHGALLTVLGSPNGQNLRNRLTPLFSFYNTGAKDWAYTASPQSALALTLYSTTTYAPQGALISGYSMLPESQTFVPQPPQPRAQVFVLTTPRKFLPSHPETLPLYWMSRDASYPPGCTGGSGCNTNNRDFVLFTQAAELEAARVQGYSYRGIQGYIYQRCSPEPSCIPQGAVTLHRLCKTADNDCAIFPSAERSNMMAQGYSAVFPAGSQEIMGYAYPNVDSDSDGLIDAFETIIGTRPDLADSDGDGILDGTEFPLAGVQVSDPCVGPNVQCVLGPSYVFRNGFESQ